MKNQRVKIFFLLAFLVVGIFLLFFYFKKNNPISYGEVTNQNVTDKIFNPSERMAEREVEPIPVKNKKVVLISIDNVRPDHLGVYGYERNTSPNIDKISQESVVFKNAYVPTPSTLPAHVSLLTGLYSKDFKLFSNGYFKEINDTSLATLFKEKGYETAAFVGDALLDNNFFRQGFNIFDFKSDKDREQIMGALDEFPWSVKRSNENTNEKALNWLDQNYSKDLFMFVHYYDAAPPFNSNCGSDFSRGLHQPSKEIFLKGTVFPFMKASDSDIAFLKARYDNGVFCDDKSVGELIEKMKTLDIYKDATIIIISDHGEYFDHSILFHGYTLYEESIKIAMIIKSPLFKNDIRENETPVTLTDIFPTLSKIFQLSEEGKNANGFNLSEDTYPRDLFFITPNLAGEGFIQALSLLKAPEGFFDSSEIKNNENPFFYKAVISDNKKLIMAGNDVDKIYDLSKDSRETTDLKNDESYNQFKEEEKNKTEDFFIEINPDYLPVKVVGKPAN